MAVPAEPSTPPVSAREPVAARAPATEANPAVAPVPSGERLDAGERIVASPDAIVLDDPGAPERTPLQLRGKLGDRHDLQLRLAMSVTMELGTRAVPATEVPAMQVSLRAEVTAVDDTQTTLAIAVTAVEVGSIEGSSARVRDAMTRTADRLRSATGSLRVSHDGQQIVFEHPTGADAAAGILEPELGGLAAAWQELMPALPAGAAVGVGARWHSVRHVRRDTVELEQRGRWTLSAVADGTQTLALDSEHAATQADDAAASMVKAQRGTTVAQIVLGSGPVPVRATATVTTTTRASLSPLGGEGDAAVRTTLTLDLSRDA